MAYIFTLLFLLVSHLTPSFMLGEVGLYHVEVVLAVLTLVFSIPNIARSGVLRAPQTVAIAGFIFASFASVLATGWITGAVYAFYAVLPPVFGFYMVAVNCRRKLHFQLIIFALLLGTIIFLIHGVIDLRNNTFPSEYIYGDAVHPRIRGLGFVSDPNDFAQLMLSLIPCLFFFKQRMILINVFLVGIPAAILLGGMYLTHSRGSMLALGAVILFASRRKLGTVPAAVLTGLLITSTLALGWTGGRDVSMEGGADRLDLWYTGLQLIKTHPLFGVGLGGFGDVAGLTAHNSVIVCAAELGITGLFFWVLMLFSTFREGFRISAQEKKTKKSSFVNVLSSSGLSGKSQSLQLRAAEGAPLVASRFAEPVQGTSPVFAEKQVSLQDSYDVPPWLASPSSRMNDKDIRGMARLLMFALVGFLAAGWFLSRAYSLWLFMYCGMMYAIMKLATENGMTLRSPDKLPFLLRWSAYIAVALLAFVSLLLRSRGM